VVEQDLGEGTTGGVADDDRRGVQGVDHAREVLDDPGHGQGLDGRRVGVERLDLHLEAGIARGQHGEAAGLVVRDPVLPAAGRDPEAVDQDDGVGGGSVGHAALLECDG
jgi:hypothetical protein